MTTTDIALAIELLHGNDMTKEEVAYLLDCDLRELEKVYCEVMTFRNVNDRLNNTTRTLQSRINTDSEQ